MSAGAAVLAMASCSGSTSDSSSNARTIGFENRCEVAIEVTTDVPTAAQPSQPWVRVEPDAWEAAGDVETDQIAIFIRLPDAETGQQYVVKATSLIQTSGGPLDLLVQVEGSLCPG